MVKIIDREILTYDSIDIIISGSSVIWALKKLNNEEISWEPNDIDIYIIFNNPYNKDKNILKKKFSRYFGNIDTL